MQLRSIARRAIGVLATTSVAFGVAGLAAPAANASVLPQAEVGYLAQAYGTYATSELADLNSGPTGYTGLACTTAAGKSSSNNTAKVDLGKVGQAGATVTNVESVDEDGVRSSVATSETAGVNLLGGLVTADALTSTSTASWDGNEYSADQNATLANLRVLGAEIDANPAPNTEIEIRLPGVGSIGKLELNKQEMREINGEFRVATTALKLSILSDNPLGLPTGTQVTIGQSRAHLLQPQIGYLTGSGFATQAKLLDGTISSGRTSAAGLACTGGTSRNAAAAGELSGIGDVGAAETTAQGEVTEDAVSGTVTNEIAGVSLLNGLIEAEAIKSVASVDYAAGDSEVTLSAEGSQIAGLKINGEDFLEVDIAPNTEINLAGIATVTLNKQVKSGNKIAVTQIEIVLADDVAGLPTGSTIQIGHAEAAITPSV